MLVEKLPVSLADLCCRNGEQTLFHERAAAVTRERFGRRVFVRAVLEVSNYCRENCHYCGMRRDNRSLERYRASLDTLTRIGLECLPPSVTDVNLQAGEDPVAVREVVLPLVRRLRAETRLGVSVCLGTLDDELYGALREAGAEFYILKFETANPVTYARHRSPGTWRERFTHLHALAEQGWLVSSGFIAGLPGEGAEECWGHCQTAARLPLRGCSVSPFVPGESTPLADAPRGDLDLTLNCLAALRLLRPDWAIPAVSALNIGQPESGYRRGLRAGANLVTMNLTPTPLRDGYLLYRRDRFIMTEERVLRALEAEGLEPSPVGLLATLRETVTAPA